MGDLHIPLPCITLQHILEDPVMFPGQRGYINPSESSVYSPSSPHSRRCVENPWKGASRIHPNQILEPSSLTWHRRAAAPLWALPKSSNTSTKLYVLCAVFAFLMLLLKLCLIVLYSALSPYSNDIRFLNQTRHLVSIYYIVTHSRTKCEHLWHSNRIYVIIFTHMRSKL